MKSTLNKILVVILLLAVAGCSNDFLNENLDTPTVPAGDSTIFISPEWESDDYQISLPGMGDAGFKIEATPPWLQITTTAGTLVNSIATIHCSATKMSGFDKAGIYLDKIEVSVGKQTFYIPVAYLTEGNPTIQVEKQVTLSYGNLGLQIYNQGEGLLIWDVVSLPAWLDIDKEYYNYTNIPGTIIQQYGSAYLPFTFNPDEISVENSKGRIVLKTNDKKNPTVEIEVTLNLGNPEIGVWPSNYPIDFGATATSYSMDIDAWGSGILLWHFEDLPEWLSVTPSKGLYNTHTYYEDVVFTCDRAKLQPGVNSAVIYLKSNAYNKPSMAINVIARAPGDNTNVRDLGENIVDVTFNKKSNTLYYVTSTPNKLIALDAAQRTVLYEIQLSKVPTCLAVSEDYVQAAVGHNGQISIVNLGNRSTTSLNVNGTLYDIAWGIDDWFCYTTAKYSFGGLYWANTSNLTTSESSDNNLYGYDIVKKLPGQPYIIATRSSIHPTGFMVYSVSTKNLKSYAHRYLSNFWLSQDGQYIFGVNKDIYRASTVIAADDTFDAVFNPIGQFKGAPDYYNIKWADHSSSSHTIRVLGYSQSAIYQFGDNDFTYQKSYQYSDVYQPNAQSAYYEVEGQYVFSNKEDTELLVLRKGITNNKWSVEFIQVVP